MDRTNGLLRIWLYSKPISGQDIFVTKRKSPYTKPGSFPEMMHFLWQTMLSKRLIVQVCDARNDATKQNSRLHK